MSSISTHILDVALGRPAAAITVHLSHDADDRSQRITSCITDTNGRVRQLLPDSFSLRVGTYRLSFETGNYFTALGMQSLYPLIEIAFVVRDPAAHYHIPLLLAANGYSTYRGT